MSHVQAKLTVSLIVSHVFELRPPFDCVSVCKLTTVVAMDAVSRRCSLFNLSPSRTVVFFVVVFF